MCKPGYAESGLESCTLNPCHNSCNNCLNGSDSDSN